MPRRKSSIADDLVLLPWWVSVVLAVLAFVFLPALLPSAFAKSGIVGLVSLGLLGIAAISALRGWKTARMLEPQTGLDSLRELHWKRFEDLLGEAYRRQGYNVEETLGGGADGGVDLVLRRAGEVTLVQCKRWKGKPVPVQVVREMYGILAARHAAAAKVVATTSFTSEAVDFASGKRIELVDGDSLLHLLRGVQTSGRIAPPSKAEADVVTPPCPQCSAMMVKRTAKRGANIGREFWGCSRYPGCKETRDI